jgi:hypothetical protein
MGSEISDNAAEQYKHTCSGKGCIKEAKFVLKIKFIDKSGLFCPSCAQNLLQERLGDIINGEADW